MVFVGIRYMHRLQLRSVRVLQGLERGRVLSLRAVSFGGVRAGHLQKLSAKRLDFLVQTMQTRLLRIDALATLLRRQPVAH
jgi:hypothetical protein